MPVYNPLKKLQPKTFRSKFILTVGTVVLISMLVSTALALRNAKLLASDATDEIRKGLTRASQEYLTNYIQTTALRVDAVINQIHAELTMLAATMQSLIDRPQTAKAISSALAGDGQFNPPLRYDSVGKWVQNAPGAPSVLSVWGYLLGPDKQPRPDVKRHTRDTAVFDLVSTSIMSAGSRKLQVYYIGPKGLPFIRLTPYANQAQNFDKLYPGHNNANYWDFFFPGFYEGWQVWLKDPSLMPVKDSYITATAPYVDATTTARIVSYFYPLWTKDRSNVAGITGVDITLDQLAEIVQSVKVADTGFAFLAMENGNVLAVRPEGEAALGLVTADAGDTLAGRGVDRTLAKGGQAEIRSLTLPTDNRTRITRVNLLQNGVLAPYIVTLQRLSKRNLWDGKAIVGSQLVLGFVVPESEIYAAMTAAQASVDRSLQRILQSAAITGVLTMLVLLIVILAISKPISAGLQELATAARRLKDKDYSIRIAHPSDDEVGEVGVAFNRMAADISYHTENLEQRVRDRTSELAAASQEIFLLNERLKQENLRLGSELDVARRMQEMVLPKRSELEAVQRLDIATFMEPAAEVGGDYYDVLQSNGNVKVGIGDVTGHGLESGVLMLMVQSVARALEEQGESDPVLFLSVLNRVIYKNIVRTQTDKYLTLAFVDFRADGEAILSGQHEEVLIVRNGGAVERIDTGDLGFPVGLEPDISSFVATRSLRLASEDVLILYTDGITEAENPLGELYGIERLCASAVRYANDSAESIKTGIITDLMAYIANQKIHDDITLVVVKQR
jgi:sigma-B regulation protein RsbU (phosphoserine phosphatase)